MNILRLEDVSLAYGLKPLLAAVNLSIESGQRFCLLGRNGEGKSSLMKVINGDQDPDSGRLIVQNGIRIGFLPQDIPERMQASVSEIVMEGAGQIGDLLREFERLSLDGSSQALERMSLVQQQIESQDGWTLQHRVDALLQRFSLDPKAKMSELSGGWRRRVLLARSLVQEPQLLLLDEPTNHLDINAIRWLEQQLESFPGALLFVSHDRAFIKRLATQIIELDRGVLSQFSGTYEDYLQQKQKQLADEQRQNALFDKKLSEEERWIRQGIKARRTRNEGRVRALKQLRVERQQRIDKQGTASLKIGEAALSGKLVAQVDDVTHAFAGRPALIQSFSTTILRGDRIGLLGVNGAGKTTLLQILLGRLTPQQGRVQLGTKLQISYFDQLRAGLDPEKSVFDNVADGHEYVEPNGQAKHVMSYLNDFLFTAERARTPVKALSGGETNRLLLARLFATPCNMIVLDEPTNDLDVDTLELLEEKLNEFAGTLLITSHDRDFLDNVVSSTLVFEGQGKIGEYVGGFKDWVRQTGGLLADESAFRADAVSVSPAQAAAKEPPEPVPSPASAALPTKKKLSYKLKLELERLPQEIENMEQEKEALEAEIAAPGFFEKEHAEVNRQTSRLQALENELAQAMERWLELEELAGD